MRKKPLILSLVAAVLILAAGALTIRIFFIWFVRVPTASMMNTVIPGDHILVTRSFGGIERGRIVAFQYPDDSVYYVARVIGLPGETIQMIGHVVYINKQPLGEQRIMAREPYMNEPLEELSSEGKGPYRVFYFSEQSLHSPPFGVETPYRIPEDTYFVMGDNRDDSEDSRYRGTVPRHLIWGEASIIYYSENMKSGEVRSERTMKKIQ